MDDDDQLLRNRPGHLDLSQFQSDTLIVKGFHKAAENDLILETLSKVVPYEEADVLHRHLEGAVWVRYKSVSDAVRAMQYLNQQWIGEKVLGARFELGLNENGKRIPDPNSHCTILRKVTAIDTSRGSPYVKKKPPTNKPGDGVSYTANALCSHGYRYPFPSGTYMSRVVFMCHEHLQKSNTGETKCFDPLLAQLTRPSIKGYAKEISEAMAMADAVQRAVKYSLGIAPSLYRGDVNVIVVGDGKHALGACAILLHIPDHWNVYSIDPILESFDIGDYQERFHLEKCFSQEFPVQNYQSSLNIVVACHSHAPLQEFWDRTPCPKIAVSMKCCSTYSDLTDTPIFQFADFEVYSPKRNVKIYYTSATKSDEDIETNA